MCTCSVQENREKNNFFPHICIKYFFKQKVNILWYKIKFTGNLMKDWNPQLKQVCRTANCKALLFCTGKGWLWQGLNLGSFS